MSIYSSKNDKTNYPSHLVSNEEKGEQWILAYCKAAWYEYQGLTASSFYHARWKHSRTKEYAMGNQPINKYKPVLGVTEDTNERWLNIDWSILPIIPKFRRIAINKLVKRDYNISATAIDKLFKATKPLATFIAANPPTTAPIRAGNSAKAPTIPDILLKTGIRAVPTNTNPSFNFSTIALN